MKQCNKCGMQINDSCIGVIGMPCDHIWEQIIPESNLTQYCPTCLSEKCDIIDSIAITMRGLHCDHNWIFKND